MSILLAIQGFFAVLFLRAAWHKLRHATAFGAELRAYRLLPENLLMPATLLLGLAEIVAAFSLHVAVPLLLLYTLAMGINIYRGNTRIDCGCGGWLSPRKQLDRNLVFRNLALAMLAMLALTISPDHHTLQITDFCVAALAFSVLCFLYEGSEQAISNHQRYRHWQQQRISGVTP